MGALASGDVRPQADASVRRTPIVAEVPRDPGLQIRLGTFFYRAEPYSTTRWLVDDHGHVLQSDAFRRGW